jgi:hypothetical protein
MHFPRALSRNVGENRRVWLLPAILHWTTPPLPALPRGLLQAIEAMQAIEALQAMEALEAMEAMEAMNRKPTFPARPQDWSHHPR